MSGNAKEEPCSLPPTHPAVRRPVGAPQTLTPATQMAGPNPVPLIYLRIFSASVQMGRGAANLLPSALAWRFSSSFFFIRFRKSSREVEWVTCSTRT